MAAMQYRYSRGQTGQGSLPRPAWGGGGGHGARATSPEPGGGSSATLGSGGEGPKERLGSNQDEVIMQLENELLELRNACAWKDQRIAELLRADTPTGRLKRDIRLLAAELHQTRKQLSESLSEKQELQSQRDRGEAAASAREEGGSPSAGRSLRESVGQLQEENRQLKDTVARLQMAPAHDGLHHSRQPSGSATERSAEPPQQQLPGGGGYRSSDPGPALPRGGYLLGGGAGQASGTPAAAMPQEEQFFQIVYSTVQTEQTATTGPRTLQGIGTLDGAASIAKVLLSRITSSVCAAHRRPAMQQPVPGQPLVMVGMPQGM